MASDEQQAAKAAAEAASAVASSEKATPPPSQQAKVGMGPREWRERARMLGSSPHAIAGALHDRGDDETLTEDEVRAALDQFSVREGLGE